MNPINPVFFHSTSLRQRFLDALDDALQDRHLDAEERTWLLALSEPALADDPDPIRVDRLSVNDSSHEPFELSAGLLLSHAAAESEPVYLFTLAEGIEVFDSRELLLTTLRARFAAGDENALFEAEKIEGDAFHAQMLAIVEQQVGAIVESSRQLKLTPTLYEVAKVSVTQQLKERFAGTTVDPEVHPLQLVPISASTDELIPMSRTLAQAAFDDACSVTIAEGYKREFFDAQGKLATVADTALFVRALSDAAKGVTEQYSVLLKAWWEAVWAGKRKRRDLAIEAFRTSARRALYRQGHDGTLNAQALKTLMPVFEPSQVKARWRCSRMTIRTADLAPWALAGTFVVQSKDPEVSSLWWFSPDHTWTEFSNLAMLTAHFETATGRQELNPALGLEQQATGLSAGPLHLKLKEITGSLCADRVDSIIAVQARNLVYAMGLTCVPTKRMAMIDDALDIRQLLDPQQLPLSVGRWRKAGSSNFAERWVNPPSSAASADKPGSQHQAASGLPTSWTNYVKAFDSRAAQGKDALSVLFADTEQRVQQYLCAWGCRSVSISDLRVQWHETVAVEPTDSGTAGPQRLISMALVPLLLECVSGHRSRVLPTGAKVVLDSSKAPSPVSVDLFENMIGKLADGFADQYVQAFESAQTGFQRQGDVHVQPSAEALDLRQQALSLDLALARRKGVLDTAATDMVRQVLNRPQRSWRVTQAGATTQAYSVSLSYGTSAAVMLCDTLVLRQPDAQNAAVLLWQGAVGWRSFTSVDDVQNLIQRELSRNHAQQWLELLGTDDRARLRAHLRKPSGNTIQVKLAQIDGHAFQALQEQALSRKKQDLRQLCQRAAQARLEANLFSHLAAAVEPDGQLSALLDGLSIRIENCVFEEMLPLWISSAPIVDLKRYYDIFMRLYLATDGGNDFLFDVPSVQSYARKRLVAQLNEEFPGQALNPDQIIVTSRRYVSAFPAVGEVPSAMPAATSVRTESLVDYAINRFVETQDASLSVHSAEQPQVASLLTVPRLKQLVRQLDVGAGYLAMLRKALDSSKADYALRKRLFFLQLPPAHLALGLAEKVEGNLSAQGYAFISQVLDMPDGIAREKLDGVQVILSPLQLVADEGMTPDPVTGVYLICPADPDTGPVVLYTLFYSSFTFREYASQSALMDDIRGDSSLQQLLLERLEPEVRRRYDRGGFTEPHLPFSVELYDVPVRSPGPVSVKLAAVDGNALLVLFNDTLKLVLDMGVSNTVTNAQSDQAGRRFLAMLIVGQVLTLLPGKLAAMLTLWQSQTLFRASVQSVSGHRWGEALSEFAAALSVMATAREQALEDEQVGVELPAEASEPQDLASAFSWRANVLTVEQQSRLQSLQAQGVALAQMRHDPALNLYRDKQSSTPYAVVDGKVYQVQQLSGTDGWKIVGRDGSSGPRLVQEGNLRWQLDLNLRLRGGGGAVTKVQSSLALAAAEEDLMIEASGMAEIRQLYRDRARRIGRAHLQARRYLENCLDNLNARQRDGTLHPRVKAVIGDFFGTANPDQALMERTETAIKTLFDAMVDPSLSPFTSERFVIGSNRPGVERVTAFVLPKDPRKRIFLTEQFFLMPMYRLKPEAAAQGFDRVVHFQAGSLIHEVSHLALDTKDIAYLEAPAPYPDLLLDNTTANRRVRNETQRLHTQVLSHRTAQEELFTLEEEGRPRDIRRADNIGYSTVLRITGTSTLNDARRVFLGDVHARSRIMLKNADSLTLLVLLLGRRNYGLPYP
jgi:hypothetical protein